MEFVIVSGLSGAGKTQAVRSLEDFGYYCVDNMPPELIPKFVELCYQTDGKIDKVAVVIDIRGGKFFDKIFKILQILNEMKYKYEILFLEASDEVLIKRYKETRRKHPLAKNQRVICGINEERQMLAKLKDMATHVIDTSAMSARQLKEELKNKFITCDNFDSMVINVVSYGFKYGIPLDADLLFDVRFLPNPYYIEGLKQHSGNEENVKQYVLKFEETQLFLKKVKDLLEFLVPLYIKEGKTQLVIGVGCTGGRHRSVTIANEIYSYLKGRGYAAFINHRDLIEDVVGDINK